MEGFGSYEIIYTIASPDAPGWTSVAKPVKFANIQVNRPDLRGRMASFRQRHRGSALRPRLGPMLLVYHGSGSKEVQLVERHDPATWDAIRQQAIRYLEADQRTEAATVLEDEAFELWDGTNGFGDEFELLYLKAGIEKYLAIKKEAGPDSSSHYRAIAHAMEQLNCPIRFIALDILTDAHPISRPGLGVTSSTVERALDDFQALIRSNGGAVSGVDRIHTALHAYLDVICEDAGLSPSEDAGVTGLFKLIRRRHPKLQAHPPGAEADRLFGGVAQIIDSLNPIRNHQSMAHPNQGLLEEPEAMLVADAVYSLLRYLDRKLR